MESDELGVWFGQADHVQQAQRVGRAGDARADPVVEGHPGALRTVHDVSVRWIAWAAAARSGASASVRSCVETAPIARQRSSSGSPAAPRSGARRCWCPGGSRRAGRARAARLARLVRGRRARGVDHLLQPLQLGHEERDARAPASPRPASLVQSAERRHAQGAPRRPGRPPGPAPR